MKHPRRLKYILFAIVVAATGCSGDTGSDNGSETETPAEVSIVLPMSNLTGFEQALGNGLLEKTDSNCVTLAGEDGTALVVWPEGTSVASDTSVSLPNGDTLEIGSGVEVSLGGGFMTSAPMESAAQESLASCLDGTEEIVLTFTFSGEVVE